MELPLASSNTFDWRSLPTTKVRRPSPSSPFSWTYTYTAFSPEFARAAIRQLWHRSSPLVLDPFLGSGTTMIAAYLEGARSYGIDISPFAALLSRTRISTRGDQRQTKAYLKAKPIFTHSSPPLTAVLSPHDGAYVCGVIGKICEARKLSGPELWAKLLTDAVGEYDSEVIAIASLALAARVVAVVERGSNPIWYRPRSGVTENSTSDRFRAASEEIAEKIISDLASMPLNERRFEIRNADLLHVKRVPKFDICVTSPPYPNRLDYVVAHLPELSVLQVLVAFSLDDLRKLMIGTTKIVGKFDSNVPQVWGESGRRVMIAIDSHSSYASKRYYYHTYYSYFDRLQASLVQLCNLMRKGAHGVIVLQDSFYKDIPIPTATICAEMLNHLKCSAEVVRSTSVHTHMGRLSPTQTTYAPNKQLSESIVYFKAAGDQ
nr:MULTISPECIES: DNA methyltransferase [unclassified Bradyrhizobium]